MRTLHSYSQGTSSAFHVLQKVERGSYRSEVISYDHNADHNMPFHLCSRLPNPLISWEEINNNNKYKERKWSQIEHISLSPPLSLLLQFQYYNDPYPSPILSIATESLKTHSELIWQIFLHFCISLPNAHHFNSLLTYLSALILDSPLHFSLCQKTGISKNSNLTVPLPKNLPKNFHTKCLNKVWKIN